MTTTLRSRPLPLSLRDKVVERLGLTAAPDPTLDGLRELYSAWCRRVPFDNVRKLVHLRHSLPGPLPGTDPEQFFEGWLTDGAGGTCWSGAGALHSLLIALDFDTTRGLATMLAAPNLPPNHGTVFVTLDGRRYLVDSSLLHVDPLPLDADKSTSIVHAAWSVESSPLNALWNLRWRPLHMLDGMNCRIESLDAPLEEFASRYEISRQYSPFNDAPYTRSVRGNATVGLAFAHRLEFNADGTTVRTPLDEQARNKFLIENVGINESLVAKLDANR